MSELPNIASAMSNSNTLGLADFKAAAQNYAAMNGLSAANALVNQHQVPVKSTIPQKESNIMAATRRLVQVFIVDSNENVPLDSCLLYKGDQKITDLTDQELFFEIDIKSILDAHNAKRTQMVDKSVKERTEHLEAARIRDLKMTVVNVAQF